MDWTGHPAPGYAVAMRSGLRLAIAAVLATSTACGGKSSGSGPDASTGPDGSGFPTAAHTPYPQAIPHGGKILPHLQLVTITYSDYKYGAMVQAFGDDIVQSTWYATVGAEYGVGAATHADKVVLGTSPPSITNTAILALIQQKIGDKTLPQPMSEDNQYVYMIYIPSTVALGADLQGEYGHHGAAKFNGFDYAYAVILDDDSGLGTTTSTAAHELVEAATDPYDPPIDGYYVDPPLPDPWYLIAGEVADLCDGESLIKSGTWTVQRIYSNAAAAAGEAPCIPHDPDGNWSSVSADPAAMPTIPAGGSATFTLTGWSLGALPDWTLQSYTGDYSDLSESDMSPTFSAMTINNGGTVTLTLHAPANATSGELGGIYVLSGAAQRPWPVGFIVK